MAVDRSWGRTVARSAVDVPVFAMCPLGFSVDAESVDHFALVGGGGTAKTGIANSVAVLRAQSRTSDTEPSVRIVQSVTVADAPVSVAVCRATKELVVALGTGCKLFSCTGEKSPANKSVSVLTAISKKDNDSPVTSHKALTRAAHVAFSPDGSQVLVAYESGSVRVLDRTRTASEPDSPSRTTVTFGSDRLCAIHALCISDMQVSVDGVVATVAKDKRCVLWQVPAPVPPKSTTTSSEAPGKESKSTNSPEMCTPRLIAELKPQCAPNAQLRAVRFHPLRGSHFLFIGEVVPKRGSFISIWRALPKNRKSTIVAEESSKENNFAEYKYNCVHKEFVSRHAMTSLELSADGSLLVVGSAESTLALYSVVVRKLHASLRSAKKLALRAIPTPESSRATQLQSTEAALTTTAEDLSETALDNVFLVPVWSSERTMPLLTTERRLHALPISAAHVTADLNGVVTASPDYSVTLNEVGSAEDASRTLIALAILVLLLALAIRAALHSGFLSRGAY